MQLGFVGLGRMGLNMVTRLVRGGHQIVAYDRSAEAIARAEASERRAACRRSTRCRLAPGGAPRGVGDGAGGRSDRVDRLGARRAARRRRHDHRRRQHQLSRRRAAGRARCTPKGIHYVDAGTSGGIWGLTEGYCLMVGGEADVCASARAGVPDARARARLPPRRRPRRRPLREDDPQRDRVRLDAGVRGRL